MAVNPNECYMASAFSEPYRKYFCIRSKVNCIARINFKIEHLNRDLKHSTVSAEGIELEDFLK